MAGFPEDAGSNKLRTLNQEINSRVMQLEELGQRGEVEGAQVMLKKVEALERDRERERVGLLRENSKVRDFMLLSFYLSRGSAFRPLQDLRWMPMISMRRWSCVMCVGPS